MAFYYGLYSSIITPAAHDVAEARSSPRSTAIFSGVCSDQRLAPMALKSAPQPSSTPDAVIFRHMACQYARAAGCEWSYT